MVRLPIVTDDESGPLPVRPRTRGDCVDGTRPCPWVGCRHNAFLEVNRKTGSLTFNFPGVEPEDMAPERSCTLDIADAGGITLDEAGDALNLTRERARQIEFNAFLSARDLTARGRTTLGEFLDNVDPSRPPVTSGHAAKFADPVVDPFAEFEEVVEATEHRIVSIFDGADGEACEFVWTMFAKKHGIRSAKSVAASRGLAAARARRGESFDSDDRNFYDEEDQ